MLTEIEVYNLVDKVVKVTWQDGEERIGILIIENNNNAFDEKGNRYYTLVDFNMGYIIPIWFRPEYIEKIEFIQDLDEKYLKILKPFRTTRDLEQPLKMRKEVKR